MKTTLHRGVPSLPVDLYADDVLRDSRAVFARVREAGPVVWLPRHRMYAMGRFADVRAALRDDEVFRSGDGVAANPFGNRLGRGTTLFSDGQTHQARRNVLMRSLGPKALAEVQGRIEAQAERVVESLLDRDAFDATADFASGLPIAVVAELVGVKRDASTLLRWAAGTFDGLGPANRRMLRSALPAAELLLFARTLTRASVRPGSWGASVFDACDRGEITASEARALVIDFVAPALDTTILASSHLLWILGRNPEAWAEVRGNPKLVPAAVLENVRLAAPVRGFTRTLARDHAVEGAVLRAGSRVALLFGAANLDETRFSDPERFDLHRADPSHVGWGNGPHACVGTHLSKLEMHALLRAMVTRVGRIEVGTPEPLLNNTLQGIRRLVARFRRA